MVEKIRWNENGPRVTDRHVRSFVTKRLACEAEQDPLIEERSVREANVLM